MFREGCRSGGPSLLKGSKICTCFIFQPSLLVAILKIMGQSPRLNSEWRINKLLLPHNPYSGAKHIRLSFLRPFHFQYSIGASFCNQTNTILYLNCTESFLKFVTVLFQFFFKPVAKTEKIDQQESIDFQVISCPVILHFKYVILKSKILQKHRNFLK